MNGRSVSGLSAEEATRLVVGRSDLVSTDEEDVYSPEILQLEILPGMLSRSQSQSLVRWEKKDKIKGRFFPTKECKK